MSRFPAAYDWPKGCSRCSLYTEVRLLFHEPSYIQIRPRQLYNNNNNNNDDDEKKYQIRPTTAAEMTKMDQKSDMTFYKAEIE